MSRQIPGRMPFLGAETALAFFGVGRDFPRPWLRRPKRAGFQGKRSRAGYVGVYRAPSPGLMIRATGSSRQTPAGTALARVSQHIGSQRGPWRLQEGPLQCKQLRSMWDVWSPKPTGPVSASVISYYRYSAAPRRALPPEGSLDPNRLVPR